MGEYKRLTFLKRFSYSSRQAFSKIWHFFRAHSMTMHDLQKERQCNIIQWQAPLLTPRGTKISSRHLLKRAAEPSVLDQGRLLWCSLILAKTCSLGITWCLREGESPWRKDEGLDLRHAISDSCQRCCSRTVKSWSALMCWSKQSMLDASYCRQV